MQASSAFNLVASTVESGSLGSRALDDDGCAVSSATSSRRLVSNQLGSGEWGLVGFIFSRDVQVTP